MKPKKYKEKSSLKYRNITETSKLAKVLNRIRSLFNQFQPKSMFVMSTKIVRYFDTFIEKVRNTFTLKIGKMWQLFI